MSENAENEQQNEDEPKGVVDAVSIAYVVGGIPVMALFFVVLFGLTGACDSSGVLLKF